MKTNGRLTDMTLDQIGDFFNNLGTMIDNYSLVKEVKKTYKKEKK